MCKINFWKDFYQSKNWRKKIVRRIALVQGPTKQTVQGFAAPPSGCFWHLPITLIKDHEKQIFDEFQQLDEEGYLFNIQGTWDFFQFKKIIQCIMWDKRRCSKSTSPELACIKTARYHSANVFSTNISTNSDKKKLFLLWMIVLY